MTESEVCKGCKWNHYPYCHGKIMDDIGGFYKRIDNHRPLFKCGRRDSDEVVDRRPKKSDLELLVEDLQNRITELEKT